MVNHWGHAMDLRNPTLSWSTFFSEQSVDLVNVNDILESRSRPEAFTVSALARGRKRVSTS